MGFLQEDFIGNPHKPEFIIEGDIEYPSDDDQALFEVEDLMPGDPDLILFNNIDIDNDEDYVPDEEDEYDDFLMDEDSCFDDDDDDDDEEEEEEAVMLTEDEESSNDNESSDDKSSDDKSSDEKSSCDSIKVSSDQKIFCSTPNAGSVNSGTAEDDSAS